MGKLEVLMSAMNQLDLSIIDKTGITTDALLINQCEIEEEYSEERETGIVRCISTRERGLSKSRNMALENARGEYCLLCDDDEVLKPDYERKILNSFLKTTKADIICFRFKMAGKKYSLKPMKIGYLMSLRIASRQIVFKRDSILHSGIRFDTNFGSGTLVGSGEENIFIYECLKAGLKVYYVPLCIGDVKKEGSQWFKGFNELYFRNRGKIIRRMMGRGIGSLYAGYFILSKYNLYKKSISFVQACKCIYQGLFCI